MDSDELICCAFICGLPVDVSSQLRAGSRISGADLPEVIKQARVLMDERIQGSMAAVAKTKPVIKGPHESMRPFQRRLECYACGGNHHVRYCRQVRDITCFRCELAGHIARNCPMKNQGNDNGKLLAPTVSPKE